MTGGSPEFKEALKARLFWLKVAKQENGCWLWTGQTLRGYGRTSGSNKFAHRAAYVMVKGPIPAGLTIDHLCRNHGCVNPAHLEAVTNRENILRGDSRSAQNARKTCCKRGHPFDAENTYIRPNRIGRQCRACHAAYQRDKRERKKQRGLV